MEINFQIIDENEVVDSGRLTLTEAYLARFSSTEEAIQHALDEGMYTLDDETRTN